MNLIVYLGIFAAGVSSYPGRTHLHPLATEPDEAAFPNIVTEQAPIACRAP